MSLTMAIAINAFAQIPTNGLVAYYPFSGNANDLSGNVNNGTVNGATLTTDRFGNANSAYQFYASNQNYIEVLTTNYPIAARTISAWVYFDGAVNSGNPPYDFQTIFDYGNTTRGLLVNSSTKKIMYNYGTGNQPISTDSVNTGAWKHIVFVMDSTANCSFYINGVLKGTGNINSFTNTVLNGIGNIGRSTNSMWYFNGKLDDIRIYNVAIDSVGISALYNEGICYTNITVTDTLIINTIVTTFNPITYQNTIKIFPNPTHDQITINYGNYIAMNGYTLKITNSLGQVVFTTPINQAQSTVNLSTWNGNGLYFVNIIDATGNIIDIKKIVLQ